MVSRKSSKRSRKAVSKKISKNSRLAKPNTPLGQLKMEMAVMFDGKNTVWKKIPYLGSIGEFLDFFQKSDSEFDRDSDLTTAFIRMWYNKLKKEKALKIAFIVFIRNCVGASYADKIPYYIGGNINASTSEKTIDEIYTACKHILLCYLLHRHTDPSAAGHLLTDSSRKAMALINSRRTKKTKPSQLLKAIQREVVFKDLASLSGECKNYSTNMLTVYEVIDECINAFEEKDKGSLNSMQINQGSQTSVFNNDKKSLFCEVATNKFMGDVKYILTHDEGDVFYLQKKFKIPSEMLPIPENTPAENQAFTDPNNLANRASQHHNPDIENEESTDDTVTFDGVDYVIGIKDGEGPFDENTDWAKALKLPDDIKKKAAKLGTTIALKSKTPDNILENLNKYLSKLKIAAKNNGITQDLDDKQNLNARFWWGIVGALTLKNNLDIHYPFEVDGRAVEGMDKKMLKMVCMEWFRFAPAFFHHLESNNIESLKEKAPPGGENIVDTLIAIQNEHPEYFDSSTAAGNKFDEAVAFREAVIVPYFHKRRTTDIAQKLKASSNLTHTDSFSMSEWDRISSEGSSDMGNNNSNMGNNSMGFDILNNAFQNSEFGRRRHMNSFTGRMTRPSSSFGRTFVEFSKDKNVIRNAKHGRQVLGRSFGRSRRRSNDPFEL